MCIRDSRNVISRQQALPWHIGVKRKWGQGGQALEVNQSQFGYDDFKQNISMPKPKALSVICSDKSRLDGHHQRVDFVRIIKQHFGDRLDWYGKGFTSIEDKWDAIAPYCFHICLENASVPHYWTEKLSDAYLGGAFPIYYGCKNIEEYFHADAFQRIDIAEPSLAISTIEARLKRGVDDVMIAALKESKLRVLDQYNLFPMIAELVSTLPSAGLAAA